jgi:hypothetical protein
LRERVGGCVWSVCLTKLRTGKQIFEGVISVGGKFEWRSLYPHFWTVAILTRTSFNTSEARRTMLLDNPVTKYKGGSLKSDKFVSCSTSRFLARQTSQRRVSSDSRALRFGFRGPSSNKGGQQGLGGESRIDPMRSTPSFPSEVTDSLRFIINKGSFQFDSTFVRNSSAVKSIRSSMTYGHG